MQDSSTREAIAAEVRAEMARQNKLHRELADVLGVMTPNATMRLQGRRSFTAEELAVTAEWLGVPVEQFIGPIERVA